MPRNTRTNVFTEYYNWTNSEGKKQIREPRGLFSTENAIMWVARSEDGANDILCYLTDIDDYREFILGTYTSNVTIRSMVEYGGNILIFPDKKSLDTDSLTLNSIGTGTYPSNGSCPDIDYACVYGGISRVFGVKGDHIYANEYGKFDKWVTFEGIESDSWGIEVASEGDFNGVVLYKNHIVAFKPNFTHEQWGTRPPFRIQDIFNIGTIDHRSIKEVNGKLFFCSKDGVYTYEGGKQKLISFNLNKRYQKARAGTDGRKYYLSMYDGTEWNLFVYDTWFDLWIREDNLNVIDFTYYDGSLYALTDDGNMFRFNGGAEQVTWEAITEYYAGDIKSKYVNEIRLRFEVANDSSLSISIQYDNGEFEEVETYTGNSGDIQTMKCSIVPKQAYRYRIKFTGTGYSKLHAMEVLMAYGGD